MPTFTATLGLSIRAYGTAKIEADTMEQAAEQLRSQYPFGAWDNVHYPAFDTITEPAIVDLSNDGVLALDHIILYHEPEPHVAISQEELTEIIRKQLAEMSAEGGDA